MLACPPEPTVPFGALTRSAKLADLHSAFEPGQIVNSSGALDEDVLVWEHAPPSQSVFVGPLRDVTVGLMLSSFDITARFRDGSVRRRHVCAGQVTLLSMDQPFSLHFEGEARILNVSLSPRLMHLAAGRASCASHRLPTRSGLDDPVLRSLVSALHYALVRPDAGLRAMLRQTGLVIAGHLLSRYGEGADPVSAPCHAIRLDEECARVARHLQSCIDEPCRIEELAHMVSLSPSTLTRRFKSVMGVPPKQYHLRLRLEHARDALLQARSSVTRAALEAGFDDLAHFSRLFKKQFGRPPSAFIA